MFREILISICVDIIHGFRVELVTIVDPEIIINDIILVAYRLLQKIKQDNSNASKKSKKTRMIWLISFMRFRGIS